jgi:hypothetical protein
VADGLQREAGTWSEPGAVEGSLAGWEPPTEIDCRFWVEPVPGLDTVLAHALCPAQRGIGARHWMRAPDGRLTLLTPVDADQR